MESLDVILALAHRWMRQRCGLDSRLGVASAGYTLSILWDDRRYCKKLL